MKKLRILFADDLIPDQKILKSSDRDGICDNILRKKLLAKKRELFDLEERMSVRPEDLTQSLLDTMPQVVHFSGHGTAEGALCFEDEFGMTYQIEPDGLSILFEQFSDQVHCVLFNACYSEAQAKAVAKHIAYVIGMNREIGDKAAISFAVGFYQALGAGLPIEDAYHLGCVQIKLHGIPEELTPVLIKKDDCPKVRAYHLNATSVRKKSHRILNSGKDRVASKIPVSMYN